MSDSDSAQRRRPPTIDLTAQEVEASRPANESESPTASAAEPESPGQGQTSDQAAGRAPRRTVPYIVSGLIGAVVVAAAVAVLWFIGLVPPRGNQAQQAAADSSATPAPHSTKMSEIEAQLDRLP